MSKINRKNYEQCVRFFFENKAANICLEIIYKFLPLVMFAAYPALLICSFFFFRNITLKLTLVPLGVLILVSVLRLVINAERPYEKYDIPSVFNKQTKGKSMPSRHTASASVIAMTFLYVSLPLGITAMTIAVLIGISRILAGAHFIRDVAVGCLIGVISGIVFLFII